MKKALRIAALVLAAVVAAIAFAACAPQKRMDAYVQLAHPNARIIAKVSSGAGIAAYVLCEAGAVRIVMTDRNFGSADIEGSLELDANHVSCNE